MARAPRTPRKTPAEIRENAQADRARKAASKAALKAATKPAADEPVMTEAPVQDAHVHERRHAQDRAAAVATAKADAEATGVSFAEMCAEMGIDETGAPAEPEEKAGYSGPMVALKTARLAYVPAANGVLCNGDALALICGKHERAVTVRALIKALKLESNPYSHLNPGQQSMNLRNKARHALKNGLLTMAEVEAAYKA